jgi:hypothetical protein
MHVAVIQAELASHLRIHLRRPGIPVVHYCRISERLPDFSDRRIKW